MLIIWALSIYIPSLGDCSQLNNPLKILGPNPWNLGLLPYLGTKVSAYVLTFHDMGRAIEFPLRLLMHSHIPNYEGVRGRFNRVRRG